MFYSFCLRFYNLSKNIKTNFIYKSHSPTIIKKRYVDRINNNKILGCCGVYPTSGLPEQCVELVKFYLPKESRGKGIGKKAIQLLVHHAFRKMNLNPPLKILILGPIPPAFGGKSQGLFNPSS